MATLAFGRGTVSFPALMIEQAARVDRLSMRIQSRDRGEDVVIERDTPVLVGANFHTAPSDVRWLYTSPLCGQPHYPVVLDVLESALAAHPTEALSDTATAIAPSWEDLSRLGLVSPEMSYPRWDDVQGGDGDARERYLLGAAARAVAELGEGFGVLLRGARSYDQATSFFVRRLLREARLTGIAIAFEAPRVAALIHRYGALRDYISVPTHASVVLPLRSEVAQLLAVAPHGLPARCVEAVVGPALGGCEGPANQRWLHQPVTSSRAALGSLDRAARNRLRRQIYDAWEPSGWGYLRRAGFAVDARDADRLMMQHTTVTLGWTEIGRDFHYRHAVALSEVSPGLQALVGAARLAGRVRRGGGIYAAQRHYRRALRFDSTRVVRADLYYALALLQIRTATPAGLDAASVSLRRGLALLEDERDSADRAYVNIRLLNGLALVRHHTGDDHEALALEQHAAVVAAAAPPEIGAWAQPILDANLAKLFEVRLRNLPAAVMALERTLTSASEPHRLTGRLELARLSFDAGDHARVFALLLPVCEGFTGWRNEAQELYARLVFGLSAAVLGQGKRARTQLRRLSYLLAMAETSAADSLLQSIRAAHDDAA
ncbi:hypothetical protein FHT40_006080 [Mycolicibacterium sp. BK556]|uniref:hypothetical protein n=1 Tax=unclassified Mycolicibacterium TaxID=2636767 RepID=UPI001617517A|nr:MULTISPECIES: hypothetical protein [unclassified Mycolicibacterium]MBB3606389.1 hypothetical protein [Mycolicibacterium sp. BK556]MBB3636365.1 hypothetical protein [Mycolicibacterium sp. BK607]